MTGRSPAHRRLGYSRNGGPRLWRLAAVAGILSWVAACALPNQPGSLARNNDASDITHSVSAGPSASSIGGPLGDMPLYVDADLGVARAAASAMLDHDGQESAAWENPATGARGTITRVASTYSLGGTECRDFLSSYLRDNAESWLQGEACRDAFGHWGVRDLRPWGRS